MPSKNSLNDMPKPFTILSSVSNPKFRFPLLDVGQIASVDARHEGEFFLRDPTLPTKFLYAQPHIVSDIRLHAYRL